MLILAVATPTPAPSTGVNPDLVTPGFWGFAIIFLIAVVAVLLIIDMTRRIRRVRYRADVRERLAADEAAAAAKSARRR